MSPLDLPAFLFAPHHKETATMTTETTTMTTETQAKPAAFDSLSFVMAYEGGELDEEAIVDGFQHLIDSGMAWKLQGSYGRMADRLIAAGYCHA